MPNSDSSLCLEAEAAQAVDSPPDTRKSWARDYEAGCPFCEIGGHAWHAAGVGKVAFPGRPRMIASEVVQKLLVPVLPELAGTARTT